MPPRYTAPTTLTTCTLSPAFVIGDWTEERLIFAIKCVELPAKPFVASCRVPTAPEREGKSRNGWRPAIPEFVKPRSFMRNPPD